MPRIAAIALALCLACPAFASAEDAPSREGAEIAPSRTGNLSLIQPKSFVCDVPGPPSVKAREKRQPIPPGKDLNDLCPASANVLFYYDHFPSVADIPPPLGLDSAASQPQPDTSKTSQ